MTIRYPYLLTENARLKGEAINWAKVEEAAIEAEVVAVARAEAAEAEVERLKQSYETAILNRNYYADQRKTAEARATSAEAKLSALGGGGGVFICTKCNADIPLSTPANPWRPNLGDPVQMARDDYDSGDWRQDWVHAPMFFAGIVTSVKGPDVWIAGCWPIQNLGDLTSDFAMEDLAPLPTPEEDR